VNIETYEALSNEIQPLYEMRNKLKAIYLEIPSIESDDYIQFMRSKIKDAIDALKQAINTMFGISIEVNGEELKEYMKRKISEWKAKIEPEKENNESD